jgi:hypothetical protein
MPSSRSLLGTTNEGQTLGFHPENLRLGTRGLPSRMQSTYDVATPTCQGCCCKSSNTGHIGRTCATLSSSQPVPSLPLPTSDHNHHNFLHLCQFHENLYVDMSHGTNKRRSFAPRPHEASQARDKGVRDRINSILEIQ